VVPLEEVSARFPADRHSAFVALSYTRLNGLRAEKCAALRGFGYTLVSYVSSRATTFADFQAGDNCFILEDNTVQPRVRIGNNVTIWSGNHIGHHAMIEDDVFVASHVVISGGVTIGAGSFLGVNSTVRDHVRIGRRCVIGAGAVILGDAPDQSVFAATATERSPVPSSRLRRI
jgi:sugar O-acyltransferase (sialic acid O-acetyltransferase NeuD family)